MIHCRVLGPIQVEIGGSPIELGGPVPRRLLASLSLGGGLPVSNSVLAETVWDAEPTAEVVNAIRVVVHRLRAALGPEGRACVESASSGYRLALTPEQTDNGRFTSLVGQGIEQLTADPATAAATFESALALWRGQPWAELGDSLHVSGPRARLVELRGVAVEELQAARLACGDTARAIAELSEAVIETPYRERRWELLALGLYRSGRQGQALAELRRVRDLLVDELGVEPGPALRELARRMREHDPELLLIAAPGRTDRPVSAAPPPPRITRPLSRFIGRQVESALLAELLADSRMVTVVGPAGVGKTRLAIEFAADRSDAWLVRLADVHDPQVIAATAAAAIGAIGADPVAAIRRTLTERPGLLVLDNCEHLVDDLAGFVLSLLTECPGLRVLATSRRPTGIEGEQVLPLAPLPIDGDGALELFFDRVRASRADWRPTAADRASAQEICVAVDGLPLALELAAARARSFGLADIAARLRERLDVLGATPRGSVSPHASLDAAIGWSIDQLADPERALLLRLWPFEGGFTWQAAEFVRGPDAGVAIFAGLAALVDRSVLTADVTTGHARYRMLETIRRYCAAADPDPAATRAAHAAWVRNFVREQVALFTGPGLAGALVALAAELANIRAGFAEDLHHAPLHALRTAGGVAYMWVTAGAVREGERVLRQALSGCPDADPIDTARAHIGLSLAAAHTGAPERALHHADSALRLLDESDPAHDVSLLEAHLRRCNALADLHDVAGLRVAAADFVAACERRDAPEYLYATALWGIGVVRFQDGDLDAAVESLTRARELSVRCGFHSGAGISDVLLAWCLLADDLADRSEVVRALELSRRALAVFHAESNVSETLSAVYTVAYALARLDAKDTAARLHAAVTDHAERLGTDPRRYLGFAGTDLAERVAEEFARATDFVAPQQLSWSELIELAAAERPDL
ncbi:AfsR/SARP family transcriptional regulator [Nocardia arthritidis]|uniref:AfsR/SARP family transcriptional regulator n=1 Tax=Nocardia arthritidis TaxID=228602 RepID=A0A6G9Y422_9NOCA|nr:AfsR/SARP family transcriptional regulator [Nocardia arthritidis]QIS07952.1 AfsR/SARP family transcriptional regulator [Nocardia arthritidis]